MALVLNEEHTMLRDSAKGFLRERAPVSHLRALRDSGNEDGFSRELWSEMAEMGWTAILVPEEHGGLGYGYTGLGILLEEMGRTLTPSPLPGTGLMGVCALTSAGSQRQCEILLPAIAAGKSLIALAVDESGQHNPQKVTTRAESIDGGFRISGSKTSVTDGQVANSLIVSTRTRSDDDDADGISLFLVPADTPGIGVERYPVLDTHAAANVSFEQVCVDHDALLGELHLGGPTLERVLDAGRIGQGAELLGIAQEAFERTMEYLKERTQFGVPIGSFQALQHRAAAMFAEIEQCKSIVLSALHSLDEGDENIAELASLVKAKLSETAHNVAAEAIQMHGGIGMTDDFDIGFFIKRCRVLETLLGDRYFHLDRFAMQRGY